MTPAIALLVLGGILFEAARHNQSVVDVLLGRPPKPKAKLASAAVPADLPSPRQAKAGTKVIDGKPVALWIVPYVLFARHHGWKGKVTSGWRDPRQVVTPSPGLPVAPQGKSNHNKVAFPGGAIDVSDPDGFAEALSHFPGPMPLKQGKAIGDPIHFSATGR